jgi:cyanophycinase
MQTFGRNFMVVCICFLFLSSVYAAEVGPDTGSLVLVGGYPNEEIIGTFIELAGGPQANIVVIPTATGIQSFGPAEKGWFFKQFNEQGACNVHLLHTWDRDEADSDAFVEPLRDATGVYFNGGRQWRLADVYLGTQTEEALWDVLDRGGVIGGNSAGATIQGSYMIRGDTKGRFILMGDHEKGMGFLRNVVVDQHIFTWNRQFDLLKVVNAHPHLLGIGIAETTAIVVQQDEFEVIGQKAVGIYDPNAPSSRGEFYFLSPGDRFDLKTRTATRPETRQLPLWMPHLIREVNVPVDTLKQYIGGYEGPEFAFHIRLQDSDLYVQAQDQPRVRLKAVSVKTFIDEANGQIFEFEMDHSGAVHHVNVRLRRRQLVAFPENGSIQME